MSDFPADPQPLPVLAIRIAMMLFVAAVLILVLLPAVVGAAGPLVDPGI